MHIFVKIGGEEKLRGEERLHYLNTYLHCFPLIFSKIFSLAPLARLQFTFIRHPHSQISRGNTPGPQNWGAGKPTFPRCARQPSYLFRASAAAAGRCPQLEVQTCNVTLPTQPQLYFPVLLVLLSLTSSFQSALKYT